MKNLYIIIALFLLGAVSVTTAQVPNWEWAKGAGGAVNNGTQGICTDASGNVYVTGGFSSHTITFGSYTLVNNSLTSGSNIYVVKYDSSGNVLWAKSAGGSSSDAGQCISLDASGEVFVSGSFSSQFIIFGSDTLVNSLPGSSDFFLAKYDPAGFVYWATSNGIANPSTSRYMSADAYGNVYTTGSFTGFEAAFASDTASDTLVATHGSTGNSSIYLIKYGLIGNVLWTRAIGGTSPAGFDYGQSIIAGSSYLYITGYLTNDTIRFAHDTLTGSGFLLLKYDSTGAPVWARKAGYSNFIVENGQSITTDDSGNIYITGGFPGAAITFGNTTLTNTNSATGSTAIYLVKYSPSGNVLWARGAGGTGYNISNSVSADASGNAYITGDFGSLNIIFGNDTLTNAPGSAYTGGIFVAEYDSSGNQVLAKGVGGDANETSTGISADAFGSVYITGYFQGPAVTFANTTLTSANNQNFDYFTAKMGNHLTTGVPGLSNPDNKILVYPNPSAGNFLFSGVNTGSSIQVYNLLGELVYTSIAGNNNYPVNISNKAKGIYFYRVTGADNSVQAGKIILE